MPEAAAASFVIPPRTDDWWARRLLAALLLLSVAVACFTKTTYDSGDSIAHYLFARYAFEHPENFLHSWAKPVYVLLTVLPAQAGFRGIMLFNCGAVALAAWAAYRLARRLELPWPWLAIVFTYAAPDYFRAQFSGLTEPLFSTVLVCAAALTAGRRVGWGTVLVSFLPLVRSEGFLMLGVWLVYLALTQQWRHLPKLGIGFVVFSLIGGLFYHDFWWMFTRNAYPYKAARYGSGELLHFVVSTPKVIGWALTGLFAAGIGAKVLLWLRPCQRQRPAAFRRELFLVYGNVFVYGAAHSLFWWLGIFASFGMIRVLNGIVPLMALVALHGLDALSRQLHRPALRNYAATLVVLAVAIYPLTGARNGFRWRTDFQQLPDQRLTEQAARWIDQTYPAGNPPIAFEHPLVALALEADPFDKAQRHHIEKLNPAQPLPSGSLVVWDDWFAVMEGGTQLKHLSESPAYRLRWQGSVPRDARHPEDGTYHMAVFEKR
ncbi:hypothetical protein F0P96_07100 [Hymenobacter busanensis]|uniref:Uncharacterized protein n=1 Tax=Hymenobacter busanensis TaxID=2607656 RepID=A0A7L5A1A5_9BACT|nr:hypothetical protein [Hymenobacter busanensis]KAA9338588.1 hypothetical protein F0P96_07100 [Hymenobacter busanensis]QHJ08983.1 hypothetical protein GUY19_17500 [Hymenobacter busanensis]